MLCFIDRIVGRIYPISLPQICKKKTKATKPMLTISTDEGPLQKRKTMSTENAGCEEEGQREKETNCFSQCQS